MAILMLLTTAACSNSETVTDNSADSLGGSNSAVLEPEESSEASITTAEDSSEDLIITTVETSEAPIITVEESSEDPIITAEESTKAPIITTEKSSEKPITTPEKSTEAPILTAEVSTKAPIITTDKPPEKPIITADVSSIGPVITAKPPKKDPIPTAQEVAKNMGIGLNLGNTMEAYNAANCEKITYEWIPVIGKNTPKDYETCWGAVETTQAVINGIKAEGFDTVRIPVFWGNMMKNDGTYTINSEYIARVKEIVDYCQKADLYTVVNIHHFDEFIIRRNSTEKCKEIFTNLWTQIAEYFKDYPYTLVFEGYNEYLGGSQFNGSGELAELSKNDAYKMTNTLNQAFVDAVRATGGNNAERVLIVSGYWTNIDNTTSPQFVMPKDTVSDRLMVSVHYVDNLMYWINQIGGQSWLDYTDSQIALLNKAFTEKNIPVFMGETSAGYPSSNFARDAIYKDSSECVKIILEKLIDNGFVPVIWDVNDNFYSRTEYRIKLNKNRAVIKELSEKLHNN